MKFRPEQILDAAIELFDHHGVGVSTAKVAKGAGVSNGTLFNYYPTKQHLLDGLYVHVKTQLAEAIGAIHPHAEPREQAYQVWSGWLGWATDHPRSHRVSRLLHESGLASTEAIEQTQAALAPTMTTLAANHAAGVFVDLPLEYIALSFQHQIDLAAGMRLSRSQSDLAFQALWTGLTTPNPNKPRTKQRKKT